MVKKFHLRRLDLNTKILIKVIFEFSVLWGKKAKFQKIRIFNHNLALHYSTGTKSRMRESFTQLLKKSHVAILEFLNSTGKISKFRKIRIFERISALNYSSI